MRKKCFISGQLFLQSDTLGPWKWWGLAYPFISKIPPPLCLNVKKTTLTNPHYLTNVPSRYEDGPRITEKRVPSCCKLTSLTAKGLPNSLATPYSKKRFAWQLTAVRLSCPNCL